MNEAGDVQYVKRLPTTEEFKALRIDAGWEFPPDSVICDALTKSVFGVCVQTAEGRVVGMGRIVGDGGLQLFVTDIIVHKDWRNRELATGIVKLLVEYVQTNASPAAFVGLFSALGLHRFYEKFGFIARPNEKVGPGMVYVFDKTQS